VHDARFDNQVKNKLREFSEPLIDKEDYIFHHRLMSEDPLTLQEIGNHYGISRERVRQIEKRLMGKLRHYLEVELPDYFDKDLD
jgi:RNA polymerase sigma-32 factor